MLFVGKLDAQNARERIQGIREALRTETAARATIIIAHRLGSLMDADEILFLEQGRIVELRYFGGLPMEETAEVLGCAVGTVKSQTHDAVQALRRGLAATRREAVEG